MAVIESKGDGYALYNGVKLPKLSDVEVESDIFDGELPYQFVFRNDSNDFYVIFSKEPFLVEYGSFNTDDSYVLYDWYWDSENLILNGVYYGTSGEFFIDNFEPIWSNHDIINIDDGDSVYFPASEDPIPLDGMNVIEWDGVNEPPIWDGSRDGHGMWDYGDGTVRLAPYAEVLNAISVIGGEVYTYTYIDTTYWEVYESFEACEEEDYERRGVYADREYGICAVDRYYDGSVFTSLIAYTPAEEPTTVDYTITYDGTLGTSPTSKTVTVNEGESYALTADDLPTTTTNRGYAFYGWSKTPMEEDYVAEGYEISGNITLYAVWGRDCTITYHTEHGVTPPPVTIAIRSTNTPEYVLSDYLPVLEADGYAFKGWSLEEGSTNIIDSFYLSSQSENLYAVWEATTETFTLTYQTEHGIAPEAKTVTVNIGESYLLTADDLPTLEAEGYTFKGWTTNGTAVSVGDIISADTTLTAVWEEVVKTQHLDLYIPVGNTWVKKDLHETDSGAEWKKKQVKEAYKQIGGEWVKIAPKSAPTNWLTFSSAEPFTIGVSETGGWNGTLYYSTDAFAWSEWDGTTISSAKHVDEQRIYMRGTGNSRISYASATYGKNFVLTGNNIRCDGNIENLLDYETVANGGHPTMSKDCFLSLFQNCTALISAPELPATTLADNCYYYMFSGCKSLKTPPKLPATTVGGYSYRSMFSSCTSLTSLPSMSATSFGKYCCQYMFSGCTSIKLSETQTDEYPNEYRIPMTGSASYGSNAFIDMFANTGGTFTGTPKINTTYYTSNTVV